MRFQVDILPERADTLGWYVYPRQPSTHRTAPFACSRAASWTWRGV